MNTNKIFASVFNAFRRFRIKENKVTLIEKLDTGGTGSLYEIEKEFRKRPGNYEFHVIKHSDYDKKLSNLLGLIRLFTVKVYHLATSRYVFLNDNFIPMAYMNFDPDVKIIQLWHGMGSFKKFAGSSEKDPEVLSLIKEVNSRVTCILASSENIRDNYAEAFCAPKEKVQAIGCPQADYYFRKHDVDRWKEDICKRYPAARGKKWILYAPTFRGDEIRDRELLDHFDFQAFERELGQDYCLMVRLHPQIHGGQVPSSVIDMTSYPNVRKLLCMTDILIADYSSIAVEYALLGRPILIYAFDKSWYLNEDRGFYFDFEKTAPGPIAESMEELLEDIREQKWNLKQVDTFARLHNDFFDSRSARRIVDYALGGNKRTENENKKTEKNLISDSKIRESNTQKDKGSKKMKIIVGLGNPTDKYKGTRHNIGFMALDKIAEMNKITINQHKHKALVGSGFIGAERVLLMKPLTYMNLSGEAVRAAADFYKVEIEDILIIYDDISLEPGKLRIRKKGSAGGHNGIKSIIQHMGGDNFPRIRVGIGGERHPGMDLADYVLGHFDKDELVIIGEALENVEKATELIVMDDMNGAMNKYNTPKQKKPKKKKVEEAPAEEAEEPKKED